MLPIEQTFIMIKPDGVARGLVGSIISRFEQKGLQLGMAELMRLDRQKAEQHYAEHKDKPFFGELVDFITQGPVMAMMWQGPGSVQIARMLIGRTNPAEAAPGTIRGDYAWDVASNVIHGSDSPESARRELSLFFGI